MKQETEQGTLDRKEALQQTVANLKALGVDHNAVMEAIQDISDVIDTQGREMEKLS